MAVLDWLQQLLGGGDPEAEGAAQASTAMQPATQPFVNLARDLTNTLAVRPVTDAFGVFDRVLSGQGFTPEEALGVATLPIGGSALSGGGGGLGAGIRAFHGSPHSFDRFDLSKIGTGEGAQAYGHGLYFAESEPVARSYRDKLSHVDNLWGALDDFMTGNKGVNLQPEQIAAKLQGTPVSALIDDPQAINALRNLLPDYNPTAVVTDAQLRNYRYLNDRVEALAPKGHMYEVDINAKPEDFLNWDKRLREQSPQVQAALSPERLGLNPAGPVGERGYYGFTDETGRLVGRAQTQRLPEGVFNPAELGMNVYRGTGAWDAPVATEKLREAGIPGIRYLDQGSRNLPANKIKVGDLTDYPGNIADTHWQEVAGQKLPSDPLYSFGENTDAYQGFLKAHHDLVDRNGILTPKGSLNPKNDFDAGYLAARDLLKAKEATPAAAEGSHNYAIWTPEIITILRRYGLLPPLAAGGLLAAPGPAEAGQP